MEIDLDRRYCFWCDEWLGDPDPDDQRGIRSCDVCQRDSDAYQAAVGDDAQPRTYRGTVPLGTRLDGWPTEVVLVTLDVWDRHLDLSLVERPGTATGEVSPRMAPTSMSFGDMPPRKLVLRTDQGSVHHGQGLGGGGDERMLDWSVNLAPTLPASATRVDLLAIGPRAEGRAAVTIDPLPAPRPARISSAPGRFNDPGCPSCGPPPAPPPDIGRADGRALSLEWAMPEPPPRPPERRKDERRPCRGCIAAMRRVLDARQPTSAMPERILPIGVTLVDLFGSRLAIPSIVVWPAWFDLTVVGPVTGPWGELMPSMHAFARCEAVDDVGRHYHGAATGGRSGLGLYAQELSFIPALDPAATELTITFPSSIDGTTTEATFPLTNHGVRS